MILLEIIKSISPKALSRIFFLTQESVHIKMVFLANHET